MPIFHGSISSVIPNINNKKRSTSTPCKTSRVTFDTLRYGGLIVYPLLALALLALLISIDKLYVYLRHVRLPGIVVDLVETYDFSWADLEPRLSYAPAQSSLGSMYAEGTGIPRDDRQAASWYRKAAVAGDAKAIYHLALMYSDGIGVSMDDEQAAYWYRKAAYLEYALAQCNLAAMYARGTGVPRDEKQTVYWYCKATGRGDAKAQSSLAQLYAPAADAPEAKELAYFCWLFSAHRRNVQAAYADRDIFEKGLTSGQRANAVSAANACKPR